MHDCTRLGAKSDAPAATQLHAQSLEHRRRPGKYLGRVEKESLDGGARCFFYQEMNLSGSLQRPQTIAVR